MLLNTQSAAPQLGIKTNTLEKMRMSGAGPTFLKIGRKVLYRQQDLDAFLEANLRQSTSDKAA